MNAYDIAYIKYKDDHVAEEYPLFYLKAKDKPLFYEGVKVEDLRIDEYESRNLDNKEDFVVLWDVRLSNIDTGIINIARTIFICMLLSIGAIYFSKDANELVL